MLSLIECISALWISIKYANKWVVSIQELCNFLSLKHCPSGEVSRVYVGKILDEDNLRVDNIKKYGYNFG